MFLSFNLPAPQINLHSYLEISFLIQNNSRRSKDKSSGKNSSQKKSGLKHETPVEMTAMSSLPSTSGLTHAQGNRSQSDNIQSEPGPSGQEGCTVTFGISYFSLYKP